MSDELIEERDTFVPMRDGVSLCVDIFRPGSGGRVPALVAMSPYGKEIQSLPIPPQPPTSPVYSRQIEAGSPSYLADHGYAHIIADVRGIGRSGDLYRGWMSRDEASDGYDLIEWVAAQPWCDGNVGMVGVSYFGTVQLHVAATKPPHLRAIMPWNAPADFYRESTHHGGILHTFFLGIFMGAIRGRHTSELAELLDTDQLTAVCQRLASDPDLAMYPDLYNIAINPDRLPTFFDVMANDLDGPYYWERSAYTKYGDIEIPTYCASGWWAYAHMHLHGAFQNFAGIKAPTKLYIESRVEAEAPMPERYNAEVVRWYDHWLKGKPTGVLDEPPIRIHVRNVGDRFETEWPLARTQWTEYHLRRWGGLSTEPESEPGQPDLFVQQPVQETGKVATVDYLTEAFNAPVEITGPMALTLYAALNAEDTNWIVALADVGPDGTELELSRGFLKASHRAVDPDRSTPWRPFHPHQEVEPVNPGEVVEYRIELAPIANLFLPRHRLRLSVGSQDHRFWPPPDPTLGLGHTPWHVCSSRTVTHCLYHEPTYPSRLLLPLLGISPESSPKSK